MITCKSWNGLPNGAAGRWMRVYQWEEGAFPNIRIYAMAVPCYHCENPVCVDAANAIVPGSMYKEGKYGAVLIDPDKSTSVSLRAAWEACPYGAIVFDSDAPDAKGAMCNMCIDRLEQGMKPVCVMSCTLSAMEFGPMDEITAKYGTLKTLEGMPDPSITKPSVVFKAPLPKKQIVPYDSNRALELWQPRGPDAAANGLPPVFTSASDVTNPPSGLVRRTQLVLKAKNNKELLFLTRHEE
jgi:anaerobic dimethyl sulfoxide reductase subunit B (iron-sulfur subunit)